MIMEEEKDAASPPPLRLPTPDHPPYSEMVQCAIRALAEPHGSTEPSISSYIEAHYDSLPWGHSKLLPYYLNKLVLAGEIAKLPRSPNRYNLPKILVNPNPRNLSSRSKRGHGRPKKVIPCNDDGEDVDRAKLVVSPDPDLEIVRRDPAVKNGRGRPRKVTPHVDGESNSEFARKGRGNECRLIVNPSPNPDPEILCHDSTIKSGHGRPWKIVPHADGVLDSGSLENDAANRCSLIGDRNPEIVRCDLWVKDGRGRPQKITSHIDDEDKCGSADKGNENRDGLNGNPNPNHLLVGSSVTPKVASLAFNREANHDPNSLFSEPELNCVGERPRLVLKLKKRKPEETGGDGGDVMGGWMCLKEEQPKERELEDVKVGGGNEEVLALQDKDLNAVKVDEHFEELLALQEKDSSGIKIDERDEGFLALQEKDLDWMQIDGHEGDVLALQENGSDEIKSDGQNEEMLPLEANRLNGIKVDEEMLPLEADGQNEEMLLLEANRLNGIKVDEEMLPLEANGLNGIKVDEHNEELLLPLQGKKDSNEIDRNNEELSTLQEKDLNAIKPDECNGDLLALEDKYLKDTEIDEHNEELLLPLQGKKDLNGIDRNNKELSTLQEKGLNAIKPDECNGDLLALKDKYLKDTEIDEHNEELLLPLQGEKDSKGIDRNNEESSMLQEKDLNAIKPDERNGVFLALEAIYLKDTEIGEHNEELLVSKVVLDAKSSQSNSDQGSLHKKAKPKKTRRLWYEG